MKFENELEGWAKSVRTLELKKREVSRRDRRGRRGRRSRRRNSDMERDEALFTT
jgi:hypothetical protein